MGDLTHPSMEELLRLMRGELPDPPAGRYEEHLLECEVCQQKTSEMRTMGTVVDVLRGARAEAIGQSLDEQDQARVDRLIGKLCASSVLSADATPDCSAAMLETSRTSSAASEADLLAELCGTFRPPEQPDELGRLGNYRVLRLLGAGGMGGVFLAEDVRLGRPVALKVMRPRVMSVAGAAERFLREAKTAAAVRHDYVVTVFEVGQDNAVPFLAMELLEGESLADRLRRESVLPIRDAVIIALQIAEGLAAAHAKGLIHRDIKPANVWLEQSRAESRELSATAEVPPGSSALVSQPSTLNFRVKLLDFGLARLATDDMHITQSGLIVGTPAYMAPEQASGSPMDSRADLFSLGTVLYQMTTGTLPFAGRNTLQILHALANHQPAAPTTINGLVPRELSDLIVQLLSKSPETRPASTTAVVQRLREIEHQLERAEPSTSRPHGVRSHTSALNWLTRRTAIALSLVGTIMLAVAIVFLPQMFRDQVPIAKSTTNVVGAPRPPSNSEEESPPRESSRATKFSSTPKELDLSSGPIGGVSWSKHDEIACGFDNGQLLILDGKTKDVQRRISKPPGKILALRWSPDGTRIAASGHFDPKVWDRQLAPCDPVADIGGAFDLVWSPDARLLACARGGAPDGQYDVGVWDFARNASQKFAGLSPGGYFRVDWSADGEYLAAGCYDNSFCVWSKDGKVIHSGSETRLTLPHARSVAWKPKSGVLSIGSQDGNVWFWNANGEPVRKRPTHNAPVTALAWSPDGSKLATGAEDGAIRILGESESDDQYLVASNQEVWRLAWSPDGEQLASGGKDGILRFWKKVDERESKSEPEKSAAPMPAMAPFTNDQAKDFQRAWSRHLRLPVEVENSAKMKFRLIPPGEFTMGTSAELIETLASSTPAEIVQNSKQTLHDLLRSETPPRRVRIERPFFLQSMELTQQQYQHIMGVPHGTFRLGERNGGSLGGSDTSQLPVDSISWNMAFGVLNKLSLMEGLSPAHDVNGKLIPNTTGYRLPTEEEWEFACRAGTETAYSSGDAEAQLQDAGWYLANAQFRVWPVGRKKANEFGLFDMHGNLWEPCLGRAEDNDWYRQQAKLGRFALTGEERIFRGGAHHNHAVANRSATRFIVGMHGASASFGLRAVRPVSAGLKALTAVDLPGSPEADPNRVAAELVLRSGGSVTVTQGNVMSPPIRLLDELPQGEWTLQTVSIYSKKFEDGVPDRLLETIGKAHQTFQISLHRIPVLDDQLRFFSGMPRLNYINLQYSRITGSGLHHLKSCPALRTLQFHYAPKFDDSTAERLAELRQIRLLGLVGTRITDIGISHLCQNRELWTLELGQTLITNAGMKRIAEITSLSELEVSSTKITDDGLSFLNSLSKLQKLYVDQTEVTDVGLTRIKDLPNLKELNVRKTKVTADGVREFGKAHPKCRILWTEDDQDRELMPSETETTK